MTVRSAIPFLVAVFIVAIGGTFLALQFFGGGSNDSGERVAFATVIVQITNTIDPSITPGVTIVTATPIVEDVQDRVPIPDGILPEEEDNDSDTAAPQLDTNTTPDDDTDSASASGDVTADPDSTEAVDIASQAAADLDLPENCLAHVVAEGDTPFGVAFEYEVDPFLLLQASGLTEENATLLQIGDILIVPLEGCPLTELETFLAPTPTIDPNVTEEVTPEPTEEITEEAEATAEATETATFTPTLSPTPTVTPTITLAPTDTNAQVEVIGFLNIGDVTAEGVRIRNTGSTVEITGWTLRDDDGNEYVFAEQRIFSNSEITVFTRAGDPTPVSLYWGLDEAVWEPGDVLTLLDADGNVQASERIEEPIELE